MSAQRTLRMLVTVPRIEGQTAVQQRANVRCALLQSGDYYGRRISVVAADEPAAVVPAFVFKNFASK